MTIRTSPRHRSSSTRSHALLAGLGATIVGCTTASAPPADPKTESHEVTKARIKAADAPELAIFMQAKQHFKFGMFTTAKERFDALKTSFPDGPYGEYAQIKAADSQYESANYTEAATAYEEFFKSHPTSPSAAYALYRQARSQQVSARGAGRDPAPLEKAVSIYSQIVDQFPNSPYAKLAEQYKNDALSTLAAHDELIAQFYERQEQHAAAASRLEEGSKKLVQRSKANQIEMAMASMAPSAPRRGTDTVIAPLVQAKRLLPSEEPASDEVAAPLIIARRLPRTNNSISPVQREALTIRASRIVDTRPLLAASEIPDADTSNTVVGLECAPRPDRAVYLSLTHPITHATYISGIKRVPSPAHAMALQLPDTASRPRALTCGTTSISVTQDGLIAIQPVGRVEAIALASPPRLVLVFE